MSSIYTVGTSATQTMTRSVIEFFHTVKSGFRTAQETASQSGCQSDGSIITSMTTPRYKSYISSGANLQKIQSQAAKRKRKAKYYRNHAQEKPSIDLQSINSGMKSKRLVSYEMIAQDTIGKKGPVVPYLITKTRSPYSVNDDHSSTSETLSSQTNGFSTNLLRQDLGGMQNKSPVWLETYIEAADLNSISRKCKSWGESSPWIPKRLGIRALTAEQFKQKYRVLESEVSTFEVNCVSIKSEIRNTCSAILVKQGVTSDFLQYTSTYCRMFEDIEREILNIKTIIDSKDVFVCVENILHLEAKFQEGKLRFESLPEFFEASNAKRMAAESNLYELGQFCTLVENQETHKQSLVQSFILVEEQYDRCDNLLRHYIWDLRHHFEILKHRYEKDNWFPLFLKFKSALKRSRWENLEAHQNLNAIVCRRNNILQTMKFVNQRLEFMKRVCENFA